MDSIAAVRARAETLAGTPGRVQASVSHLLVRTAAVKWLSSVRGSGAGGDSAGDDGDAYTGTTAASLCRCVERERYRAAEVGEELLRQLMVLDSVQLPPHAAPRAPAPARRSTRWGRVPDSAGGGAPAPTREEVRSARKAAVVAVQAQLDTAEATLQRVQRVQGVMKRALRSRRVRGVRLRRAIMPHSTDTAPRPAANRARSGMAHPNGGGEAAAGGAGRSAAARRVDEWDQADADAERDAADRIARSKVLMEAFSKCVSPSAAALP